MSLPKKVKLVEVGPRDGLQNEASTVPTDAKIEFINRLSLTGLKTIEVTSFVSPNWIPKLADHQTVFAGINKAQDADYPILLFNQKELDNALDLKARSISLFATPSEQFCQKNANCSVEANLARLEKLIKYAKTHNLYSRVYISCVLGCPYEGNIPSQQVVNICDKIAQFGADEISLGDTIGIGTALNAANLVKSCAQVVPIKQLAVHFHDTYGQALANIYACLQEGIEIIDTSVAGLGGCPYAPGATGNVATEDVLYMLNGLGIHTGVDLTKLIGAGKYILNYLDHKSNSRLSSALPNND